MKYKYKSYFIPNAFYYDFSNQDDQNNKTLDLTLKQGFIRNYLLQYPDQGKNII